MMIMGVIFPDLATFGVIIQAVCCFIKKIKSIIMNFKTYIYLYIKHIK
jgi:hypothetical protein